MSDCGKAHVCKNFLVLGALCECIHFNIQNDDFKKIWLYNSNTLIPA